MIKTKTLLFFVFCIIFLFGSNSFASIIYQSDFQNGDTSLWSNSALTTDNNGKKTLGLFDNQNVSLVLPNQSAGTYNISFDFYTLFSWDGNGNYPGCCGPDYFTFQINGVNKIHATFGGVGPNQSYSNATPLGGNSYSFAAGTDSTGTDILSYTFSQGNVSNFRYTPTFTFEHFGGNLTFSFIGGVTQPGQWYLGFRDETWTLDNVTLSTPAPEPSTLLLLSLGLGSFFYIKKRK